MPAARRIVLSLSAVVVACGGKQENQVGDGWYPSEGDTEGDLRVEATFSTTFPDGTDGGLVSGEAVLRLVSSDLRALEDATVMVGPFGDQVQAERDRDRVDADAVWFSATFPAVTGQWELDVEADGLGLSGLKTGEPSFQPVSLSPDSPSVGESARFKWTPEGFPAEVRVLVNCFAADCGPDYPEGEFIELIDDSGAYTLDGARFPTAGEYELSLRRTFVPEYTENLHYVRLHQAAIFNRSVD